MLEVQLLGKFAAKLDDQHLDIPSRPAQALLAYLILNTHKSFRREKLAGLLWPESDEPDARNNLRQTLWRLRKLLGDEFFLADKVSVGFNAEADYRLDADQLQTYIDDNISIETLIQVVAVYEDKLLPGFYDSWVTLEQERLQAVYEDRMQLLLARLVETARWREAREWAEQWIAQGLTPEPAYRALMMAQAGLGDLAGVAAVYQRCTEALDEELGVEPSAETQTLFQRLTTGEVVPPPQTTQPRPRPTVKLPLQPTPFIGRHRDLREMDSLLNSPTTRLVTILGPGGIGKTRLAVEAAQAQSHAFADGVYFVSLASVDAPDQIAAPIAMAINFSFHIRDQGERWENDSESDQLLAYLRDKRILLILDNLEHLLAEIPFIADLLQSAGEIKILATSRERLGLRGETVYPIGSLHVPITISEDVQAIVDRHDAIQLFINCAKRAQPTFALTVDNLDDVINICQLVDGMPLGIELAAAWVGLLTPREIAAEIKSNLDFLTANWRDIPARHQSIRSVFESSWQQLTATEQDVFQQLSIFRGGFTRQAAEYITGAMLPSLMALANKSLIQPDYTGRYHIHELLRQFGGEHLAASTEWETAVRDRHCAYYTAFLKQREPHLDGQDLHKTLTEISIEIDNVRRAWQWAITHQKLSAINDAMEGLCEYYRIRGFLREAYD
ncbi:MAG: AAA family ATPase, partial [Anaerolineae bacterium]|nr:AAA family ATPase [Anaerolineae bacterium]